jgi:hypothetical protein
MHCRHAGITIAIASLAAAACSGEGPAIDPIDDQVVAVGEELAVEIRASNGGNSDIRFDYSSNAPSDDDAAMSKRPDGTGLFTWTPGADDVGSWTFDFTAADGSGKSSESVTVEVRSAVGSNSLPNFRRPLGAGTAITVAEEASDCVEVEMVVTDQDSTEVSFAEEEPRIEGGMLLQDSEFEATWRWCPTPEQKKAQDRYVLTLSADDGINPKSLKRYQIILRNSMPRECAGLVPTITHAAADQETINPLRITVEAADESGLKAAPLIYYSTMPPSDPPDLEQMTMLHFALDSGDTRSGTFSVEVPHPIPDAAPGTSQILYYVVVAEDNDDSGGKCDHIVTQSYQMNVTVPGGDGGLGSCEPCTTDAQCGGATDNCLRVGVEGEAFCFTACTGAAGECAEGYVCSANELESIEGAKGRQCVPMNESCEVGGSCPDDTFEQNDGRSQAQAIEPGATEALRMCPLGDIQADEDWYSFTVTGDTETTLKIAGDTYPNMELSLLDESGKLVAASEDWGSDDDVKRCLKPGTYTVRVYSYFSGENDYSLELTTAAGDCRDDGGGTCEDDAFEDDDGVGEGRIPDFEDQIFRSSDNQICTGDDDWFFITLFEGETIWTTLSFDQVSEEEDLDLLVYDQSGALLTPCTEEDPSGCDADNGQSGDADEQMMFTAPSFQEYYVVVHGWNGAENSYEICMGLEAGLCTIP